MTLVVLVALILATWRLTSLIVEDTITDPVRRRVAVWFPVRPSTVPRRRWPVELINCVRCLSVWIALATVCAAWSVGLVDGWRWVVLGWWTVAGGVTLLFERGR